MPSPRCKICIRNQHHEFEQLFRIGKTHRQIAATLGCTTQSVNSHLKHRHKIEAQAASSGSGEEGLLVALKSQEKRLLTSIADCTSRGDYAARNKSESELLKNLSLQARLKGLADTSPTDHILKADIKALAGLIVQAASPYPEARNAILEALRSVDGVASGHA